MAEGGFFYQAFIYLGAAVIAVPIAKKLGLGSVLGYLLSGVLIGPFVLGFIGEEGQDIMHFAEFGVVMMLFLVGLELQPSMIWKLKKPILGMGGLQVSLTSLIIVIIAMLIGLPWQTGLAIGFTLALSSTAIVLQTLNEKGLMKTEGGQNAFSVLLFQDIAVIPILAILPLLAVTAPELVTSEGHHSTTWTEGLPILAQTGITLGAVAIIIIAGKYLMNPAFRLIAKTHLRELFIAAALLLIISIAILMTKVGLSPALGTFLAGVVLAQSEFRHELESDIEPFKGLLLGLFFLAVGASIDFQLIASNPILITELVLVLIIVKFVVLFILSKFFKMNPDAGMLFTFSLAQGGEFAFVLFSFINQNNILSEEIINPLIAAVAVSMALTPLLMIINEKYIQPRFEKKENAKKEADTIDISSQIIVAGFGRMGATIGRFLQANNVQATYLDLDPNNVELLRKLGLKVFYGDASRQDLLHAAGADEAKAIIIVVDKAEKTNEVIHTVQKHFPHLEIFTRTYSWNDSYDILDKGVKHIYRETFDTSLRLASDVLAFLGKRRYSIYRAMQIFRKHDDRFLRELATKRGDQVTMINEAKTRIESLESLMISVQENRGKYKDIGWDAETLREDAKRINKNKGNIS